MTRAVLYARCSSEEQAEHGLGLEDQEQELRDFAAKHSLEVVAAIRDTFTGKVLSRPGLTEVTRLAEAGAFDVLVSVRIDRLCRRNHLRRLYEEKLERLGIRILFTRQTFEETAAGRLQKGLMGEFADFESELIRERTMGGKVRKAQHHAAQPVGNPPFGYRLITRAMAATLAECEGRSGQFEVLEHEAVTVRRIFALAAEGMSLGRIAAVLNADRTPTRKGGPWRAGTVQAILWRTAYRGEHHYGKRVTRVTDELLPSGNLKRTIRVTQDAAAICWFPCPVIVPPALWYAAQDAQATNRERFRGRYSFHWPLRGLVNCHPCARGCHTVGAVRGGRTYRRYNCPQCGLGVRAAHIEEAAKIALRKAAMPGWLARQAGRKKKGREDGRERVIVAELARIDAAEGNYAEAVLAGVSRHTLAGKIAELQVRRRILQAELAAVRARTAQDRAPEEIEALATRLRESLEEWLADPAQFQRLARLFLSVTLRPGEPPEVSVRVPPTL